MNAFLAIVGDTWRQSKQQIVFMVKIVLMALLTVAFVALPKVLANKSGEPVLGLVWQSNEDVTEGGLELSWDRTYRSALRDDLHRDDRMKKPREDAEAAARKFEDVAKRYQAQKDSGASEDKMAPLRAELETAQKSLESRTNDLKTLNQELIDEAQRLVDQRSAGVSPLRKGVEVWLSAYVSWLFTLSMWGFIAACASYYPNMLAAGAVDVLVSKPVGRHVLFFGKYAGGLVLYGAAMFACYLLAFVVMGARTGVWHWLLFSGSTLTLLSVALLYAIVGFIGVMTRSTALAIVVGYFFYFIVDSIVGVLQSLADSEFADTFPTIKSVSEWSRVIFPGFGRLRDAVAAAVVNVPIFNAQVLAVAAAWLVVCLGVAYYRFERLDF